MADARVTCTTKPHPQSPHEHITHLGNPSVPWKWTREQVIASIDAGTNTFYVIDPYIGRTSAALGRWTGSRSRAGVRQRKQMGKPDLCRVHARAAESLLEHLRRTMPAKANSQ